MSKLWRRSPRTASLSRRCQGVEFLSILATAFALLGFAPRVSLAASHEPEPQAELPQSPDYTEARELLAKQKWPEAAIVLRSLLKSQPNSVPAMLSLSRALTYAGRREEALTVLGQAAARFKGQKHELIERRIRVTARLFLTNSTFQTYEDGLTLLQDKKFKLAREKGFDKALYVEPDNVELLVRTGQSLILEDDEMDTAVDKLKLARRLDPTDSQIKLWYGRALHKKGDVASALVELKAAYSEMKDSELAAAWYADALLAGGQRAAAMKVLEEDTKRQPMHLQAMVVLARMRLTPAVSARETPSPLASGDPSASPSVSTSPIAREIPSEAAWTARRELQLVQSRLAKYAEMPRLRSEGDLGLDLRRPADDLKSDVTKLLQQADSRINQEKAKADAAATK